MTKFTTNKKLKKKNSKDSKKKKKKEKWKHHKELGKGTPLITFYPKNKVWGAPSSES